MGLDAFVYCDCYEKGRLREPPPANVSLKVGQNGSLEREHEGSTLDADLAWDEWQEKFACEHPRGELLHHRLGNIALIGLLRSELQREPSRFQMLLTKVLYSGTHGGDFLALNEVSSVQQELLNLANFRCTTKEAEKFMTGFRSQMSELVAASLSVKKPIAF